jgi:hypothetical protein
MNVVWYNFVVYRKVWKCNPAYILGLPSASTVPSQTPPRCLKPPRPPPHPLILIILRSPPPHPQGAWPTTATLLQSSSDLRFKVECSWLQVHSQPCGVPTRVSRDACMRRHLLPGSVSAFNQCISIFNSQCSCISNAQILTFGI